MALSDQLKKTAEKPDNIDKSKGCSKCRWKSGCKSCNWRGCDKPGHATGEDDTGKGKHGDDDVDEKDIS